VNKAKRYIVRQLLHAQGVMLVHVEHEMYRVIRIEQEGLTEKEKQYMDKTLQDLKAVSERLTKFTAHIHKSLP
jgi:hypothetical protein